MNHLSLSDKGQRLVDMYSQMAEHGYATNIGMDIKDAYNSFELRKIRDVVKNKFSQYDIGTVLDYGCGGSDWTAPGFENEISAIDFFGLKKVYSYEPARDIDERTSADCVVCFDVLEHIFVSDVATVLRDIFSCAKKLVILNVACYDANALLPNGENAHITVRNPHWWKGALDLISVEFPSVSVDLICSPQYNKMLAFPTFSDEQRQADDKFCVAY
tara:strand:+ start:447 stop:1094 length:648 start_codon:yes stop_codon:yes gene_type:complete